MFNFRRATVFNLVRLWMLCIYSYFLSSVVQELIYALIGNSITNDRFIALLLLGLIFGTIIIGLTSISIMEYEKGKKNHEH